MTNRGTPTHVYFDLDGTLTDPYVGITQCILYALDELGFPHPSDEYLYSCIGPSLYETFPEMVGNELTPKAIDLYRERFNEIGWLENIPYDGIHDALAAVANSGCLLFVATSKPRIAAGRIVEHFKMGQFLEKVYDNDAPREFEKMLKELGVDRKEYMGKVDPNINQKFSGT